MRRKLNKWHRVLGLISSLFVFLLASTGMMLNHTGGLNLDSNYVTSSSMLKLYGIKPLNISCFLEDNHQICGVGKHLYFDEKEISSSGEELTGVAFLQEMFIVALKNKVMLMTEEGEVIEVLSNAHGVPVGIEKVGISDRLSFVLHTKDGNFSVDENFISWEKLKSSNVTWKVPVESPKEKEEELLSSWRGKGLSLERIILDLHSGRIVGEFGVYLVDLMALLLLHYQLLEFGRGHCEDFHDNSKFY